uniref:CCHC-type domain-containing protein n=1 Tax=Poecilia reticulata TaxID=8081 RepID=A0A3P9MYW5_POERE
RLTKPPEDPESSPPSFGGILSRLLGSQHSCSSLALHDQKPLIQNREAALQELGNRQTETNNRLAELTSFLRSHFPQTFTSESAPRPSQSPDPASGVQVQIQSTSSDCQLPNPSRFDGDPRKCRGFLMQCNIQFNHSPHRFVLDSAKISYIIAHLSDRALDWAEAKFSSSPEYGCSFAEFLTEFKQAFNQETDKSLSSRALLKMKQGQRSVVDFSIDFRIQAAASGWNTPALKSAYLDALNDSLKDKLATLDEPGSLEDLIKLSIRIDNRIRARAKERSSRSAVPRSLPVPCYSVPAEREQGPSDPEPMQIGQARLTPEERQRRMRAKLCLYCGEAGHFVADCPILLKARVQSCPPGSPTPFGEQTVC